MRETTKIYLNTWGAYNSGLIGFGWMTPSEARDFIDEKSEDESFISKYGEEFFIADIDNYLGVDFGSLDYANVLDICEQIEALEELTDWELEHCKAYIEVTGSDIAEALEKYEYNSTFYHNMTLEEVAEQIMEDDYNISDNDSIFARYFDYEAFARDLSFDGYTEVENGVIEIY